MVDKSSLKQTEKQTEKQTKKQKGTGTYKTILLRKGEK
jgi:hypothetical protein